MSIGIRDLARNVSRYVEDVITTGMPLVVTKHGRPVAAIVALDADGLEDLVLAHAPEFVLVRGAADKEDARGETKPLSEVLNEIDAKESTGARDAGDEEAACPEVSDAT